MALVGGLAFALFLNIFCLVSLRETVDPDKAEIWFYYGRTPQAYARYNLTEAEKVIDHPRFNPERRTTLFIPDYYEPQLEEYNTHYLVDAYEITNRANYLFLSWGAPLVDNKDDLKDIAVNELIQRVTTYMIKMSKLITWRRFNLLLYAEGCVLGGNVARQIYYQTNNTLRFPRVTMLDPPEKFMLDGKLVGEVDDIVTVFADAIHTDIGGFGTKISRNHVNFYPNGGYDQPGCDSKSLCNRRRAFRYWAESVVNPLAFCAYKADSYEDFKSKTRAELGDPELMGYAANKHARGKYYLETNASPPFGKGCSG